jgi:hypothetical protein
MKKLVIKPFNVVDNTQLPEMTVEQAPTDGDPLEIKGETYFVCENVYSRKFAPPVVGVIPLVVRDPTKVANIKEYIQCLSLAHRKVLFKNNKGECDLEHCDEMVIG